MRRGAAAAAAADEFAVTTTAVVGVTTSTPMSIQCVTPPLVLQIWTRRWERDARHGQHQQGGDRHVRKPPLGCRTTGRGSSSGGAGGSAARRRWRSMCHGTYAEQRWQQGWRWQKKASVNSDASTPVLCLSLVGRGHLQPNVAALGARRRCRADAARHYPPPGGRRQWTIRGRGAGALVPECRRRCLQVSQDVTRCSTTRASGGLEGGPGSSKGQWGYWNASGVPNVDLSCRRSIQRAPVRTEGR
jgi:hypothetical protein